MAKKKVSKVFLSLLIMISIGIIVIGTYLLFLSKPKRIILESITGFTKSFDEIKMFQPSYRNYTVNSSFNINATGKLDSKKENNYTKLVNNINNTKGNIKYVSNKEKQELLLDYSSTIKDKELIAGKYLIKNSTEYYYVNNITDTYINNGNSTYFESLGNNTKEAENLVYLKNTMIKYFVNNIDDKYIKTKSTNSSNIIELKLDNKDIEKIYRETIKDLKNDKRARSIITSYNREFFKNNKNIKLSKDKHKYIMNIYTDKFTYSPKKYEFIKDNNKITYNRKELKVYKNNKLKLIGKISNSNKRLNISILNKNNKKIGNLSLNKEKKNKKLVFYINDKDTKTNLLFKLSKEENRKNIKQNISINLGSKKDNKELYNIRININNLITNKTKISEDVSKSQLDSSLDKSKKEQIKNTYKDIDNKLFK